jgi:hypothetical protein
MQSLERIQQLQRERDDALRRWALLHANSNQPDANFAELLRLRGKVAGLRQELNEKRQAEKFKSGQPSVVDHVVELGSGPNLSVSYDSTLWSMVSSNNPDPGPSQSITWQFDAAGTDWVQVTVASHPEPIDEAAYKQQIRDRQNLRGDPAELVTERRQSIGGREWTILELHNSNTKPPRTELYYFLPASDGYVTAFGVAEEARMPAYRENVDTFIRQIQVQ